MTERHRASRQLGITVPLPPRGSLRERADEDAARIADVPDIDRIVDSAMRHLRSLPCPAATRRSGR